VTLRVLIVDDNAPFLDAASALLQRGGLDVVGAASTTAVALTQAEELQPDVVLADIHLADESGFDLARQLEMAGPASSSKVIMMSTHAGADFADLIAESPAVGFVAKSDLSASAIRRALGETDA
jgi:two-component system nitrate/nitrite response regulator NarL